MYHKIQSQINELQELQKKFPFEAEPIIKKKGNKTPRPPQSPPAPPAPPASPASPPKPSKPVPIPKGKLPVIVDVPLFVPDVAHVPKVKKQMSSKQLESLQLGRLKRMEQIKNLGTPGNGKAKNTGVKVVKPVSAEGVKITSNPALLYF